MCLATPMELIEIERPHPSGARTGVATLGGLRRQVRLDLLENPRVGDQLLVHAGFAIQVIDAGEAQQLVALLEQVLSAGGEETPG